MEMGAATQTSSQIPSPFYKQHYSTIISSIVVSLGFLYLLKSKDEHTTLTEERAMQAPATQGGNLILKKGNKAPAATGMATTL